MSIGKEGWHVASAQGVTPSDVHFRWSRTHGDLEVISKDIRPIYYYAPCKYSFFFLQVLGGVFLCEYVCVCFNPDFFFLLSLTQPRSWGTRPSAMASPCPSLCAWTEGSGIPPCLMWCCKVLD